MADIRCQFYINFTSLMIKDCPAELKGRECYLRFIRNANDLQTKRAALDDGGYVEFNEKIEMKTFIEYDKEAGKHKPKLADLQACLSDGTILGSTGIDLASYANPNKYLENLVLKDINPNYNISKSFIVVEIRTTDAATDSKPNPNSVKRGSMLFAPNSQSNKLIASLEHQITHLTQKNNEIDNENDKIKEQLTKLGVNVEDLLNKPIQKPGENKTQNDNSEKYKKLGISDTEVKNLCNLDKEITRLFEIVMRKRNKNDEMIRNKINDLNEKPSLRNYLFKKVSDQQLQKEIVEIEQETIKRYSIDFY